MTYCRRRVRIVAAALAVTIAAGTTAGLSGCSIFGGIVNQQLYTEDNLANQRKVAKQTIRDYPHPALESIRFTSEGHVNGAGDWNADAVLMIDGEEYQELLGILLSGGDEVPSVPPGSSSPHGPVKVIYSDGTSEVLK
ncbi:hypothetical protein GCM10009820_04070 [Leifsonia soli]